MDATQGQVQRLRRLGVVSVTHPPLIKTSLIQDYHHILSLH